MTQLGLVELHTRDGSALDAGCKCIETKHLRLIEGLSSEGVSFAVNEKEKEFFAKLGTLARSLRKNMESESWDICAAIHEAELNPCKTGASVTPCDRKVERCVAEVSHDPNIENPYAVCKAQIEC
jgi:hypothetical protein